MKELQAILKAVSDFKTVNQKAILATVVALEGSGYRRPGARMLIDAEGKSIGTVSGGCLEADVLERARKVLETNEPIVITYDTTKDENSVFGLGMGCRGVIRILLESITKTGDFFSYATDCLNSGVPFAIATLIKSTRPELKIGSRLFFKKTGVGLNNFSEEITKQILSSVRRAFAEQKSILEFFDVGEVFIEFIKPPLSLLLFGAGFDAIPLADFAKSLGWSVTIIDHRAGWANAERFPDADEIIVSRAFDLDEKLFQDENSVAVVMTHNYDRDREILPRLLNSNFRYVGALGPKKRAERILDEIDEKFTEEQLNKLHAPIGLDIGADTPEEIALAIIAEIRSVLANRNGGFLRERQGSIYGRS